MNNQKVIRLDNWNELTEYLWQKAIDLPNECKHNFEIIKNSEGFGRCRYCGGVERMWVQRVKYG